jgi:hypothetical protein
MTRVFTIHGSASLHISGPKNARTQRSYYSQRSFELSDLCDKEFHKMAQNFGMMASYGEPKAKSATTGVTQQLEGNPKEPEVKKPRVLPPEQEKSTGEEEKTQET